MRLLSLTMTLICTSIVAGDEPKNPGSPFAPSLAMAKASTADGKTTITLKQLVPVCVCEPRTVTESITRMVDGRPIVETVAKTVMVTVCKSEWRSQTVNVAGKGVSVHDTAGNPVTKANLASLLAKETAMLVSVNGPVDPYHLQTTKPNTLVIVIPPPVMVPQPAPVGNVIPRPSPMPPKP